MSVKPTADGYPHLRPELTRLRNGRIAQAARQHRFDPAVAVPFICECSEERCDELVRLSLVEYTRLRRDCDFLVAPGHEVDDATVTRVKDGVWLYRVS